MKVANIDKCFQIFRNMFYSSIYDTDSSFSYIVRYNLELLNIGKYCYINIGNFVPNVRYIFDFIVYVSICQILQRIDQILLEIIGYYKILSATIILFHKIISDSSLSHLREDIESIYLTL